MDTIDAAANPAQAQQMINDVMTMVNSEASEPTTTREEPTVAPPPDCVVRLPAGFLNLAGEATYEAEVRELTGRDEEALSRMTSTDKLLQAALTRGVVRIGDTQATEEILNNLLSGDRDFLLLRIFIATFGNTIDVTPICPTCGDRVETEIDLAKQVEVRTLESPYDRRFTMDIKRGTVTVELPTGHTQKELLNSSDKSTAELSTLLLANSVTEINGTTVLGAAQVLDLPITDRRKIVQEIVTRSPGPQMQDIKTPCPNCETTLEVALPLATLFRF